MRPGGRKVDSRALDLGVRKRKHAVESLGALGGVRAVFDLLWYQELTQAEAAALLGVAVRTVKSRWLNARLRVQQELGGSPFDEPGPPG